MERFALPTTVTGSTWRNAAGHLSEKPARGVVTDSDGAVAPRWTNREAVAVIMALRNAARPLGARGFPLWYQYAAIAYGWDPSADRLDNSAQQADGLYDPDGAVQLQGEVKRIAGELDDERVAKPELRFDEGEFGYVGVQSSVAASLRQDGAEAQFKIPIPGCTDPRTGRPGMRPIKNPKTGKWECPPATIDDPITIIVDKINKNVGPLLIVLIAAAWYRKSRRTRRRR